ncbi:MAG: PEP-CTERM sorting domain-containing protein [Planctomycetales bacterium]|nr:PEP-CTERM sorting domain-containing protein [Planctomycetales bacterium]
MSRFLVWTILIAMATPVLSHGATITYGFDDGTFEGWQYLTIDSQPFPVDDSDGGWAPSDETIDIGDGFDLLPATSGDYRIVPDPWDTRDCLGGTVCYTQILRSPPFQLDGSGDIAIDMIGGAARSNQPFDPDFDDPPTDPEWFLELKDGSGFQGFGLLDIEANEYVAHGFSTGENDGKERPTDPEYRAVWETVTISQDTLAEFANNGKEYAIDVYDSYSGGWGWIGFDTVRIPSSSGGIAGDFNDSGDLDAGDMDALTVAVLEGSMDAQFDLDNSGTVDGGDRGYWIETLRNSYFGDSNLDGEFNSSDFVAVFSANEYEDGIEQNSTWAEGDWNGDRDFDSSDFVQAFTSGGYEKGPKQAAAVPEPSSLTIAILLGLGVVSLARRAA